MTHEPELEQDQSEQRIVGLPCSQSNVQLLQLIQRGSHSNEVYSRPMAKRQRGRFENGIASSERDSFGGEVPDLETRQGKIF